MCEPEWHHNAVLRHLANADALLLDADIRLHEGPLGDLEDEDDDILGYVLRLMLTMVPEAYRGASSLHELDEQLQMLRYHTSGECAAALPDAQPGADRAPDSELTAAMARIINPRL